MIGLVNGQASRINSSIENTTLQLTNQLQNKVYFFYKLKHEEKLKQQSQLDLLKKQ